MSISASVIWAFLCSDIRLGLLLHLGINSNIVALFPLEISSALRSILSVIIIAILKFNISSVYPFPSLNFKCFYAIVSAVSFLQTAHS